MGGESARYVPKQKEKYISKANRARLSPPETQTAPEPVKKFSGDRKGRVKQEAAMKAAIGIADIKPEHIPNLREYLQIQDDIAKADEALRDGTKSKRKAAEADKAELAQLAMENSEALKKAGLDVSKLGLHLKINRETLLKEKAKELAPPERKASEIKNESLRLAQEQKAARDAEKKARFESRQSATKDYLTAVERTNQVHADLMKIRRDLARAKKTGADTDAEKLARMDADMTKVYAAGRAKIKLAEKSLADAGIDSTDARFATKAEREKLYAEKPALQPEMKKAEREERAKAAEAIEMESDSDEVLGFLAAPDDIKGAPSPEFRKLTDEDYDNVGKRETAPTTPAANEDEESLEDISDTLEEVEDEADRPTVVATKPSFWQRNPVAAKVARWGALIGAGMTAILGYQIGGPKHEQETPQKERMEQTTPIAAEDLGTVTVDDANVEISQPPAEAPTIVTATPAVEKGAAKAKDGRVTLETWKKATEEAAKQLQIDADATDAQLVALGYTSQELRAGALRHNLRAFKAGNELIADMMKIDALTGNVSEPKNLLGALKIIKDTPLPDKRAYEKELRAASNAELEENLAAMAERHAALKSISSSESPVLQQLKTSELKAELQRHKEFLDLIESVKSMKIPDDNSWGNAELAQEVDLNVSK